MQNATNFSYFYSFHETKKIYDFVISSYENAAEGCVLQKDLKQSRNYFQSHGMIFDEQNLFKTVNLPLF